MLLKNKVALVTGAAQGIGKGIAIELARVGANIIIADFNVEMALKTAAEIKNMEVDAQAYFLDVTDDASVKECIQHGLEHFGRIDILVNNAGIQREEIGIASTIDQFNQCLDVNLMGIWRMVVGLVPHFKTHKSGNIINIASINGRTPWADTPAYSASKAAAINLTQSLAINLGSENINVNAVCPGGVMTAMAEHFSQNKEELLRDIVDERVLKRVLSPEDIGHAVVFFASSGAKNITGQSLNVDGGCVLS